MSSAGGSKPVIAGQCVSPVRRTCGPRFYVSQHVTAWGVTSEAFKNYTRQGLKLKKKPKKQGVKFSLVIIIVMIMIIIIIVH